MGVERLGVQVPVESGQGGPPPGWYIDPCGVAGSRWWDGYQWTGYVYPIQGVSDSGGLTAAVSRQRLPLAAVDVHAPPSWAYRWAVAGTVANWALAVLVMITVVVFSLALVSRPAWPLLTMLPATMVLVLVVVAGLYVLSSLLLRQVLRRAVTATPSCGINPDWAWVPVLNTAQLMKIGGFNPLLALLYLVPFGSTVVLVVTTVSVHRIDQRFGRDVAYWLVYVFAPLIWLAKTGYYDNERPTEHPLTSASRNP